MRLRTRLERLEAVIAARPPPEDDSSRLALGDPRAVRIAIAYDRRAREGTGGWALPWNLPEDLRPLSATELAGLYGERIDFLRAERAREGVRP